MKKKARPEQKGFTLIELLVAMSIALILMGIALVSYQGARKAARDGRRKTDLEQIRSALEMYRADYGAYKVANLISGDDLRSPDSSILYIKLPADPMPGLQYRYKSVSPGTNYSLCAALEKGGGATINCTGATDCDAARNTVCNYEVTNP